MGKLRDPNLVGLMRVLCLLCTIAAATHALLVTPFPQSNQISLISRASVTEGCMTSVSKKAKAAVKKIKSSRAAAKRFKPTATGKLLRRKAFRAHILTKKHPLRKMALRKTGTVHESEVKTYQKLLLVKPK